MGSFLDQICPTFEAAYTPGLQISIDESVISFKGRLSFRKYLKGKPNPWELKAFVLSDSKTGYLNRVNRVRIYLIDRLPVKVVMTLIQPFHNLTSNWISSTVALCWLSKVGIIVTGTK